MARSRIKNEQISIPAAIRPQDDIVSDLLSDARDVKKIIVSSKKERHLLEQSQEEEQIIDTFALADAIYKRAESIQGEAKTKTNQLLKKKFLKLCVELGYRPANPAVQTQVSKMNYVVKHVKKFNIQQNSDGSEVKVRELLSEQGFDETVISVIEQKVIKENVELGIKKLTDLVKGDMIQKELANKLRNLIKENFTPEERNILLEKTTEVTVEEGWQEIAVQLAMQTVPRNDPNFKEKVVERLDKLFTIIPPQFVLSQISYSGNLDVTKLPDTTEKEFFSTDKKYRAVCSGSRVTLYEGETLIGEKKCLNPGHAENSAKKWFKEPENLAEFLISATK